MWINVDDGDANEILTALLTIQEQKLLPVAAMQLLRDEFGHAVAHGMPDSHMVRVWRGMPFAASIAMGPLRTGAELLDRLHALAEVLREYADSHNSMEAELFSLRHQREMVRDFFGTLGAPE